MSTGVSSTDEMTEVLLGLELDEDMACEVEGHDGFPEAHEGPGVVYVWMVCPECGMRNNGNPGKMFLLCEKYYGIVSTTEDCWQHDECGAVTPIKDIFVYKGRRG